MRFLTLTLLFAAAAFGAGELSGRRAPSFALPESAVKLHDTQDYRGRILIIDFMQVSCPHCVRFSAILEQAKVKYGDKIAVLSVVNPPSDPKGVADFIAANKIKTPILFDCGQVAYSYLRPGSSQITIPHVFLIDAEGMIRNDFAWGPANANIFEGQGMFAEIDKMLAAKPAGSPKR